MSLNNTPGSSHPNTMNANSLDNNSIERAQQAKNPNPSLSPVSFKARSNGDPIIKSSSYGLNSIVLSSSKFPGLFFTNGDKYDAAKYEIVPKKESQAEGKPIDRFKSGPNSNEVDLNGKKIELFGQEEQKDTQHARCNVDYKVDGLSQEYMTRRANPIEEIKTPNFNSSYWEDLSEDEKSEKERHYKVCEEKFWSSLASAEKEDIGKITRSMVFKAIQEYYEMCIKGWWPRRYQLFIKMAGLCDRMRCSEKSKLLDWAEKDLENLFEDENTAMWLRILYFLQAKGFIGEDNNKSKRLLKNGYNIEQKYLKGKKDYLEIYAAIKATLCAAKDKRDKAREWCKEAKALSKRRCKYEAVKWCFDWEIIEKELSVIS